MDTVTWPLGSDGFKTDDWLCSGNHCMGSKSFPALHSKMQLPTVSYRGKPSLAWSRTCWRWTVKKWKTVQWSDKLKFDTPLGNHRCFHPHSKKQWTTLPVFSTQLKSYKAWWFGYAGADCTSWRHLRCETLNVCFKLTASIQTTPLSGATFHILARRCQTTF